LLIKSPKPLGLVRESYSKTEVEAWISRYIKLYYITTCAGYSHDTFVGLRQ
jgi:hypothetical protein